MVVITLLLIWFLYPIKVDIQHIHTFDLNKYPGQWWVIVTNEEQRIHIGKLVEQEFPKIDFDSYYLLVSAKKIKKLTYNRASKYFYGRLIGKPHFGNTDTKAYAYLMEKIYLYSLTY